jgi:hypothetical protein
MGGSAVEDGSSVVNLERRANTSVAVVDSEFWLVVAAIRKAIPLGPCSATNHL